MLILYSVSKSRILLEMSGLEVQLCNLRSIFSFRVLRSSYTTLMNPINKLRRQFLYDNVYEAMLIKRTMEKKALKGFMACTFFCLGNTLK